MRGSSRAPPRKPPRVSRRRIAAGAASRCYSSPGKGGAPIQIKTTVGAAAAATLRRYAAAHGVSVAAVVRQAIRHYVAILDSAEARVARAQAVAAAQREPPQFGARTEREVARLADGCTDPSKPVGDDDGGTR